MLEPHKPPALRPGDAVRVLSPASPVEEERLQKGCEELARLGYTPKLDRAGVFAQDGFFAGSLSSRFQAFKEAVSEAKTRAIFCARGGYGSNYLLENLSLALSSPRILLGYSDITSLQIFLWEKFRWVTFYGPMVASGFEHGSDAPSGYDRDSLVRALAETNRGWAIPLAGCRGAETLAAGVAEGILLGGCLTLVQATLGTPWELQTHGAIVILEDCAMKPYQVDRALMHLKQAGKFRAVTGIILGDFPECDAGPDSESVKDVARRILTPLGIPIAWGAPIGHTQRPMITLPLGVRALLSTGAAVQLEILEPACILE